jgi:hypothetical protein
LEHAFLYQHTMRSEWGVGAVIDQQDDRTTFKFDNGITRTIKRDHIHLMVRVELEEAAATEARKRIARSAKSVSAAATRKAAAKKKLNKPSPAPVEIAAAQSADEEAE